MKDTSFEAYIADQVMIGRIKESIKKEERNRVIDKVEKYLKEHIILYARTTTLDQQKEWFNNFRKAMEGSYE